MRLGNSSSAVRSTNWRYLMIFISCSTRSFSKAFAHSQRRLTHHRDRADAADRPGRAGADGAAQRGGWWKWKRRSRSRGVEPHKFRLNCRRTATASLFLGRNRTSDSTRIPVWISLFEAGGGGSKFYPAGRRARMPAAFLVLLRDCARKPRLKP
jgi:hypothetical protein